MPLDRLRVGGNRIGMDPMDGSGLAYMTSTSPYDLRGYVGAISEETQRSWTMRNGDVYRQLSNDSPISFTRSLKSNYAAPSSTSSINCSMTHEVARTFRGNKIQLCKIALYKVRKTNYVVNIHLVGTTRDSTSIL